MNININDIAAKTSELFNVLSKGQFDSVAAIKQQIEKMTELMNIMNVVGPSGVAKASQIYSKGSNNITSLTGEVQENIEVDIKSVENAIRGEMAKGVVDAATKLNNEFDNFK
ncbi:hypothetical protein [Lactobacillus sp. PV034]|uniref:hypothetical protein n=1 Tax=Lactobacillus sp. PV034 TaxID=2594495 RepID=UPI00223F33C0|nr:hypothetical protein [Lactobacillus sp. PV034]QNQ80150.1 hypothetical protein FP432_00575 [Lactobacillus sp. PV034]